MPGNGTVASSPVESSRHTVSVRSGVSRHESPEVVSSPNLIKPEPVPPELRYPESGELRIDNNLTERMLRGQAIGR